MSGLHKSYTTNRNLEVAGFEYKMEHATNDDGTIPTFIISRMGPSNPHYRKDLNAAMEPHKRKRELGTLSNEVAEKVLREVFCRTILKGWHNVQNESGEAINFTPEAAAKLMEELPDLYAELSNEAATMANFLEAQVASEGKHSLTS